MNPPDASDRGDLAQLHQEWQELHGMLRVQEQALSRALELYAKGKAERPDALILEVTGLRAECSKRFNRLMQAVRNAPTSSSEQA